MHERARGEVDSKGKQTQKGKEDQQRVEVLARGRRDEFLKESYFPKVRPSTIMHQHNHALVVLQQSSMCTRRTS